jgi:hypothetical protein
MDVLRKTGIHSSKGNPLIQKKTRGIVKKTLESDLSGSWLRHAQWARYAGKTSI